MYLKQNQQYSAKKVRVTFPTSLQIVLQNKERTHIKEKIFHIQLFEILQVSRRRTHIEWSSFFFHKNFIANYFYSSVCHFIVD